MQYKFPFNNSEITPATARFIFDQAERFLQSTIVTGSSLTQRSISFIEIHVAIMLALIGFLASEKTSYVLFGIALFASVVFSISFILSIVLFWLRTERDGGAQPYKLATRTLLEYDMDNQELTFVINEIEDYQDRIARNKKENARRTWIFKLTLFTMIFGLIAVAVFSYVAVSTS